MSYILEALKKSDAERKRGEIPTLNGIGDLAPNEAQASKSRLPWILSGALGIAVIALAGIVVLRPGEQVVVEPQAKPQPVAQIDPIPPAPSTPATKPQLPEAVPTESAPVTPQIQTPEPEPIPVTTEVEETAPSPIPEPEAPVETPVELPVIEPQPEPVKDVSEPPAPPPVTIYTPETKAKADPAPVETEAPAPPATEVEHAKPVAPINPKPVVQTAKTSQTSPSLLKSAKTYVDQAWSAIDKGFYNQAIRDLNRAVEIEPGYSDAWFARGWTNEKSGNELSAIGDYARAINAKPDHAFALFSRGYLNLYIGNPRDAVTDFIRTQGVAQDDGLRLYSHLWLYLSRMRTAPDGLEEARMRLREDTANTALKNWPGPLIRHFLGHEEEGRVLVAMDEGTSAERLERQCTGNFFLGIGALSQGDRSKARSYFEKTLATGAIQYRQYDAAKRELDRLNR